MGNTFTDVIRFKKAWRPSQISLMSHLEQDLADGRLHYIVATGAGKKSIGLELIRRLDAPALILSLTQEADNEWRTRFQEDFLPEGEDLKAWVSKDAAVGAPIISMTYQTMFAAMNIGRPFAKWLQNANVQTLCLDEPHHLRNEWWKMLQKLTEQMPQLRIITLATEQPWEVADAEWDRYREMCGPVDGILKMQELVKEGVCCPYQDYVYMCYPTKEDEEQIRSLRSGGEAAYAKLLHDAEFLAAIKKHLGIRISDAYEEFFQENPAYKMAILSYLKENGEALPKTWIGDDETAKAIPEMNATRMELLVKGFLGYDKDSYDGCAEYQKRLEADLKEMKAIVRARVDFFGETETKRILKMGAEKYPAIEKIVRNEMDALGDDMRMLILTEHIKKEQMPLVGELTKEVKDIGALPVFEILRRADIEGVYMMIMTNTLVVIPDYLVPWFEEHTDLKWASLKETGYSRLEYAAERQAEAMKWMTAMFEEGYANVLIANAAQLQEGWESRCVNSLMFATRAGHLALENRIRGLATLVDPMKKERVTNIWHVVTMDPDTKNGAIGDHLRRSAGELRKNSNAWDAVLEEPFMSEDMESLLSAFHAIVGLNRDGDGFENGVNRVLGFEQDFSKEGLATFNQKELALSKNRKQVWDQWQKALLKQGDVTEEVLCEFDRFPKTEGEKQAQKGLVLYGLGVIVALVELFATRFLASFVGSWVAIGIYVVMIGLFAMQIRGNVRQLAKKKSPQAWMEGFAKGILEALQDGEVVVSPGVSCRVKRDKEQIWHIHLIGATSLEQEAFAGCMTDFLGSVGDVPFVLLEKNADGTSSYYPVPEMFSYAKADARLFYRNMNEYMGDVILIFTGAEMGYASLKEAQWKSYTRAGDYPLHHKTTSKTIV